MGLRKGFISNIFWTFSQQFSAQIVNFIVSIILARVLLPEQYGLIGMITLFMGIGGALINSGLTFSLIRTTNPTQKDYSTVFFTNLVGSIVVYAIMFMIAPFIAAFYRQEILVKIIRLYTLSFIIYAFAEVQLTKLTKEMNFKLQMTIQIPALIISSILGIILAYAGYGVWTLVWMQLCQAFITSVLLWFSSGWKPAWIFDKERFRYHFKFGYKILLSGLLDNFYNNLYNIIIGRSYSSAQLGYYNRADSLKQLPVQNISTALNKVTYPMFASIKEDTVKLKFFYKKLMQQVLIAVSFCLVFLAVMGDPLFRCLFTAKWLPAVPYFQILCFAGIMYPIHSYNLTILNVKGRSDLFLRLEIVKKILITIAIFCAIPFGIYGLLYSQIIISFLCFFVNTYFSGKLLNYSIKEQTGDIIPIFILAITAGVLLWLFNRYTLFMISHDVLRLMIAGVFFSICFILCGIVFKIAPVLELKEMIVTYCNAFLAKRKAGQEVKDGVE